MRIDEKQCAALLKEQNDILILTHAHPDGDTLGAGFGLCRALIKIGKRARVINADDIPKKYSYLYADMPQYDFEEKFVVAVDVATENLLGELAEKYEGKIDLCIDHHMTNTEYAKDLLLENRAAACEIIYRVILELGAEIDADIANCLFTGISTDTGCFRYASVTPSTMRIAAQLIDFGANNGYINRLMFETKTKTYAHLERLALESMEFFFDGKVAVMTVTQEMYRISGSNEQETETLAPLTRQIDGVEIGVLIREKPDMTCKASLRTFESVNAAALAKAFGGGGHAQAAACRFDCGVEEAKKRITQKCGELLK